MVAEGVVLLRVQHLQKRRGGVAPKVHADLVNLVEDEHRVVGTGIFDPLDDPPRQGADIGAAVAPNLGLVPHAPQGDAHELAAHGPGDGLPQGGFAHPRRPHETENGTLHLLVEFADAQVLQDAVLDLLQVEMVLIQDNLGLFDLQFVPGALAPGQGYQPVQVGADDGGLGGVGVHLLQAGQLLEGVLFRLLGHPGLGDLETVLFHLLAGLVQVAQFFLDGPQLLPEKIFPLGAVHLLPGLVLNLGLDGGDLHFLAEKIIDLDETADGVHFLQHHLGLVDFEAQIGRHQVRQMPGVLDGLQDSQQIRRHDALEGEDFLGHLPGVAHQGLGLGRDFGDGRLRQDLHGHQEVGAFLNIFLDHGLGFALDQDFQAAVRQFQHPQNQADRAHGVDVFGFGVFDGLIFLGGQKDQAVLGQGGFNRQYRGFPAHKQRQHHIGKNHHVPDRQHGQFAGDDDLMLFVFCRRHVIS